MDTTVKATLAHARNAIISNLGKSTREIVHLKEQLLAEEAGQARNRRALEEHNVALGLDRDNARLDESILQASSCL